MSRNRLTLCWISRKKSPVGYQVAPLVGGKRPSSSKRVQPPFASSNMESSHYLTLLVGPGANGIDSTAPFLGIFVDVQSVTSRIYELFDGRELAYNRSASLARSYIEEMNVN